MILLASYFVGPGCYLGPARPEDAAAIARLTALAAPDTVPMSERRVLDRLQEYEVARAPSGAVVGCAAVHTLKDGRAELRSVVIERPWRRGGLGRLLVERAIERAVALGQQLLCVSRRPEFFLSLGFEPIPLQQVPPKADLPAGADARPRVALAYTPDLTPYEAVA